jgi:hypothetical protein
MRFGFCHIRSTDRTIARDGFLCFVVAASVGVSVSSAIVDPGAISGGSGGRVFGFGQ